MTTLPDKLIYPKPFAGGAGAVITPFSDAVDGDKVNFETGFRSAYSAPKSNGGKFVTRGEMNYLGNIATKNDYYRMCGGINTFDPVFAQKIGGYPKDAILDYFDGVNLLKVISLEENNMVDFRSGVFGGKWAKLGTNDVLQGSVMIGTIEGEFETSIFDVYQNGIFIAPKSGIVSIRLKSESHPEPEGLSDNRNKLSGCGFLCRVFDTPDDVVYPSKDAEDSTKFDYKDYSQVLTFPSLSQIYLITSSSTYTAENLKKVPVAVSRGQLISICLQNGGYVNPSATVDYRTDISLSADVYIN